MRQRRLTINVVLAAVMALAFLYISAGGALAATTLAVTGNSVNLRGGPGTAYKVVGGISKGDKVTLVASKPGWLQIKTAQGITGWVKSSFLTAASTTPSKTTASPAAAKSTMVNKVLVTGSSVNLRAGAGVQYPLAGQCKKGDLLNWKRTLSGWYEVVNAAGKTVYISSTLGVLKQVNVPGQISAPNNSSASSTGIKVQVTGSSVNLRSGAGTQYPLAGQCKAGDLMTWKKTLPGWYEVVNSAGKTVYISSSLAVLKQDAAKPTTNTSSVPTTTPSASSEDRSGRLQVTGSEVNLRSGPATSYPVVAKVKKDQLLYANKEQDGWYEVAIAGDERAWVIASLVKMITPLASTGNTNANNSGTSNEGTTPSRGEETRPELKSVTVSSGEDAQGDFVAFTGETGFEPSSSIDDNIATVIFPDSKLGTQGLTTHVNITEDKSLGFDLTASSQDNDLELKVKIPDGLKYEVQRNGNRVIVRVFPQVVKFKPVSTGNGREAVELVSTHTLTIKPVNQNDEPVTRWNLTGINLPESLFQDDGDAYKSIALNALSAGGADAIVDLRKDNICDLVKVRGDVYRFYFRPKPQPGQPITIMVDPGHGGSETGAIYYNTKEKEFNLAMGLKLGQTLEQAGYRVLYTRKDDSLVTLSERSALANAEAPDLYVSIHCNAMSNNASINGTTTYYWPGDEPYLATQRQQLASALQQSLISRLGTVNKGVRTGEFVVIKYTTMPSALVETLFLSNPEDYQRLQSEEFQWQVAQGIADGIANYINGKGISIPTATHTETKATTAEEKVIDPTTWSLPF